MSTGGRAAGSHPHPRLRTAWISAKGQRSAMSTPTKPFRVSASGGAGLTRSQARHVNFTAPSRSLRVPRDLPDTMELRIRAIALATPDGALFCGPSAAVLLDLPIPFRLREGPVWVMVHEGDPRPRRRGVRARQADVVTSEIAVAADLHTTSPARTFVDLAALLSSGEHSSESTAGTSSRSSRTTCVSRIGRSRRSVPR